jgi:hypothetical protein
MKRKIEPISFRSREGESEPLNQSIGSDKKCTEIKYKLGLLDYFIIGFLLIAAVIVISVQIYMFVLRYGSDPTLSWLKVLSPLMAFFGLPSVIAIVLNVMYPREIRSVIAAPVGIVSFSLLFLLLLISLEWDELIHWTIGVDILASVACCVILAYIFYGLCGDRLGLTEDSSETII